MMICILGRNSHATAATSKALKNATRLFGAHIGTYQGISATHPLPVPHYAHYNDYYRTKTWPPCRLPEYQLSQCRRLWHCVSVVQTALPQDPQCQRHTAGQQQQQRAAQPPVGAAAAQHGEHAANLARRLQRRARVLDDEVGVLPFGAERQLGVDPPAALVLRLTGAGHQPLQLDGLLTAVTAQLTQTGSTHTRLYWWRDGQQFPASCANIDIL